VPQQPQSGRIRRKPVYLRSTEADCSEQEVPGPYAGRLGSRSQKGACCRMLALKMYPNQAPVKSQVKPDPPPQITRQSNILTTPRGGPTPPPRRAQPLLLLSRSNPPTEGGGTNKYTETTAATSGAGAAWPPGGEPKGAPRGKLRPALEPGSGPVTPGSQAHTPFSDQEGLPTRARGTSVCHDSAIKFPLWTFLCCWTRTSRNAVLGQGGEVIYVATRR